MNAHALLVLAVAVHFGPEHLSDALGQSVAAWNYVAYGVEAGVLWLIVGTVRLEKPAACSVWAKVEETRRVPIMAVSAYGAMEGLQRAACRLALPMDRAPRLGTANVCDAATGLDASLMSLLAAFVVVVLVDSGRQP